MLPQGTSLIDTGYFTDLTARINAIDLCSELQAVVNEVMASIQAEVNGIESQIQALLPLIVIPTDLGSVIKWITAFASPLIQAYENAVATLTQTLAAIASLVNAIEAAASRLTHCSIAVPAITVPVPTLAVVVS